VERCEYLPRKALIEGSRSSFLVVKCKDCGSEQIIFSNIATIVNCKACKALLAKPTGGKSVVLGQVLKVFK